MNHALKTREEIESEVGFIIYIFYPAIDAEMTPLMYAARHASLSLISLLVKQGADIGSQGSQAVDYIEQNRILSKIEQEQARRLLTHPTDAEQLREK